MTDEKTSPEKGRPGTYSLIKTAFIILIFFLLFAALASNWQKLEMRLIVFNPSLLAISFAIGIIQALLIVVIWRRLLRELGFPLGFIDCFRIYYLSQAGKYLPGGVWSVVGRAYLGEREQIPKTISLTGFLLETALSVVAGTLLGLPVLILFGISQTLLLITGASAIILIILILNPKIFFPLLNRFLILLKRDPIEVRLEYGSIILMTVLSFLTWLIGGVSFYAFAAALTPLPINNIFSAIGVFAAAGVLSILAFFSPGGLGIRELTLTLLLSRFMPTAIAVIIAVGLRIWIIIDEMFLFIIALISYKLPRRKQR